MKKQLKHSKISASDNFMQSHRVRQARKVQMFKFKRTSVVESASADSHQGAQTNRPRISPETAGNLYHPERTARYREYKDSAVILTTQGVAHINSIVWDHEAEKERAMPFERQMLHFKGF